MNYKAVLFDLDGTLLDTLEDLGDSMNSVLAARGYATHPMPAYTGFVGDGVRNLVLRSLPAEARGNDVVVDELVPLMRSEYSRRWKSKTRPYEGIPELLDGLALQGMKLAVLSNKPHPATVEVVAHFLGRWRFDAVLGARPDVPLKPDAGAALEVCRMLSIPPESFLYLGDTDTDMMTAAAAGMFPVGVLWGFRTSAELLSAGAKVTVSRPGEVLSLLATPAG
jgi:phosphoglycolate phosphatase